MRVQEYSDSSRRFKYEVGDTVSMTRDYHLMGRVFIRKGEVGWITRAEDTPAVLQRVVVRVGDGSRFAELWGFNVLPAPASDLLMEGT